MYSVLIDEDKIQHIIATTDIEKFQVDPATIDLSRAENPLVSTQSRELR